MRLKDKVAIITGGGSGIGRGIALNFAKEGANIVIPDINLEGARSAAKEVETLGRGSLAMEVDISKTLQVKDMVQATLNQFGKIDILVNNAVYVKYIPFLEFGEEEWDKIVKVSLGGYFLCSQAAAREMVKRREGKIVSIASMAAQIANVGSSAYSAAKAGVLALTRVMAIELGQYNINVNAISPGVIETPLMRSGLIPADEIEARLKRVPMGRVGRPEDIAMAALFLASEESSYITGHVLNVEGGFLSAGIMPKKS